MRELYSKFLEPDTDGNPISYVEISGDSDETKPTTGIADGSIFTESDTGKVYFFNEASSDWVEQFAFQA